MKYARHRQLVMIGTPRVHEDERDTVYQLLRTI